MAGLQHIGTSSSEQNRCYESFFQAPADSTWTLQGDAHGKEVILEGKGLSLRDWPPWLSPSRALCPSCPLNASCPSAGGKPRASPHPALPSANLPELQAPGHPMPSPSLPLAFLKGR